MIEIEHVACSALIDTRATVSTISSDFYDQYLSNIEIHPLDDVLHIECTDGQHMPYAGYISASMKPYGTTHDVSGKCSFIKCLLHIAYNDNGSRYQQDAQRNSNYV